MTPDDFRAFRFHYGLPQSDLARALGVGRSTIIDIESGRTTPSRLLLLAMAAYVEGLAPYSMDPADPCLRRAAVPRRVNRRERSGASLQIEAVTQDDFRCATWPTPSSRPPSDDMLPA